MTVEVDHETISHADARESVDRAKSHVGGFWSEVKWQVDHKAWEVLGYADLDAMWAAEYESTGVSITSAQRPELAAALRSVPGQTQQKIADKLRVSQQTVGRDLIIQMDNDGSVPTEVTNARGQQRPATYKVSKIETLEEDDLDDDVIDAEVVEDRQPNRQQYPPQLTNALTDLERVTRRLEKITSDDRFSRHKVDHAPRIRRLMKDMIDICQQTIERLPGE